MRSRSGASTTLAGTGASIGSSFTIKGTSTSARANVLVGQTSASDTNTISSLTLKGGSALGNSTIADANLNFNLSAASIAGNQLSVGNTGIAFGTDAAQSVTLTLNITDSAPVANNTAFVLIAGNIGASTTGLASTAASTRA